jgi:hypothetical protein
MAYNDWLAAIKGRLRLGPPKQTLPQISCIRMRPISLPSGAATDLRVHAMLGQSSDCRRGRQRPDQTPRGGHRSASSRVRMSSGSPAQLHLACASCGAETGDATGALCRGAWPSDWRNGRNMAQIEGTNLDGSAQATAAMPVARGLAELLHATVAVLHVTDDALAGAALVERMKLHAKTRAGS